MFPDSDPTMDELEENKMPVGITKPEPGEIKKPRSGWEIVVIAIGIYLVAGIISAIFLVSKWRIYAAPSPFLFIVISRPTVFLLAFKVGVVAAYQNNYQKIGKGYAGGGMPSRWLF